MATKIVTKRYSVNIDKQIADTAELVIRKIGLKPNDVISMMLTQIADKGKLHVAFSVDDYDHLKDEIIAASRKIPAQKVETSEEIADFFAD